MYEMRTFLVTGASSDIGKACIEWLKRNEHKCIALLNSNNEDEIERDDGFSTFIKCDLRDVENLRRLVRVMMAETAIDGFISLAAINKPSRYRDTSLVQLEEHLKVNALAPVVITQCLVDSMKEKKWGRIVYGSSVGVKFGGGRDSFAYSYSKHAVEFISSELRSLAKDNVLVNSVRIGVTDTKRLRALNKDLKARAELIPAKRVANPKEIAEYICWLASEKNTYVSGEVLSVAGGE